MDAMQPVWRFLHNLEGFEFAAFWIASFTAVTLAGFFLDYIMQKQGFGPYFNACYVAGGVWLGLYLRYNYLQPGQSAPVRPLPFDHRDPERDRGDAGRDGLLAQSLRLKSGLRRGLKPDSAPPRAAGGDWEASPRARRRTSPTARRREAAGS